MCADQVRGVKRVKTFMLKKASVIHNWYLVDAKGKRPGRLAARVATVLQGKHKTTYTPHVDGGDFVVVVNASQVAFTGNKRAKKEYKHFSGYPGGLKLVPAEKILATRPEQVIRLAVKRMLPKSRLGVKMLRKLKVYAGPNHPHRAQKLEPLE